MRRHYRNPRDYGGGGTEGGMPQGALLSKFEATADGGELNGEEAYRAFARGEAVDRRLDKPFLESDAPRGGGQARYSRGFLNQRYNGAGTRGSGLTPSHPDLFLGFTGSDPRGASNTPRFDQMRKHMMARIGNHAVRMGDNSVDVQQSTPWTGIAFQNDMQKARAMAAKNLVVFTNQRSNHAAGRSSFRVSTPEERAALRASTQQAHLAAFNQTGNDELRVGVETEARSSGFVARPDAPAPWTQTTGDATLGVARYNTVRSALGTRGDGSAVNTAATDNDWKDAKQRAVTGGSLGARMAQGARERHARTRAVGGDANPSGKMAVAAARSAAIAADVNVAIWAARHDQTKGDSRAAAVRRAAAPHGDLQAAGARSVGDASRVDTTRVAKSGRSVAPGDAAATRREALLNHSASVLGGRVTASYHGLTPGEPERRAEHARATMDRSAFARSHQTRVGRTAAPGEGQAPGTVTVLNNLFGPDVSAAAGGLGGIGSKNLRAGAWSHSTDLVHSGVSDAPPVAL
jgi:hypothetical protein